MYKFRSIFLFFLAYRMKTINQLGEKGNLGWMLLEIKKLRIFQI